MGADWDESQHPRNADGTFAGGAGSVGHAKSAQNKLSKARNHNEPFKKRMKMIKEAEAGFNQAAAADDDAVRNPATAYSARRVATEMPQRAVGAHHVGLLIERTYGPKGK